MQQIASILEHCICRASNSSGLHNFLRDVYGVASKGSHNPCEELSEMINQEVQESSPCNTALQDTCQLRGSQGLVALSVKSCQCLHGTPTLIRQNNSLHNMKASHGRLLSTCLCAQL